MKRLAFLGFTLAKGEMAKYRPATSVGDTEKIKGNYSKNKVNKLFVNLSSYGNQRHFTQIRK